MKVVAKQMDYKTFKNEVFASLEEVARNLDTRFDKKDNEDAK